MLTYVFNPYHGAWQVVYVSQRQSQPLYQPQWPSRRPCGWPVGSPPLVDAPAATAATLAIAADLEEDDGVPVQDDNIPETEKTESEEPDDKPESERNERSEQGERSEQSERSEPEYNPENNSERVPSVLEIAAKIARSPL